MERDMKPVWRMLQAECEERQRGQNKKCSSVWQRMSMRCYLGCEDIHVFLSSNPQLAGVGTLLLTDQDK